MVTIRCKMAVKAALNTMGIKYSALELGEVDLLEPITNEQREVLQSILKTSGLFLMDDKKSILIQRIKNVIVEMIHYLDEAPKVKISTYLAEKLDFDYTYLANLFTEFTGMTIEHYTILHKTERVKELLMYDELTLTEIAYMLNYSSVAHLSNQFKKVTGLTPTYFKQLKNRRRKELDSM